MEASNYLSIIKINLTEKLNKPLLDDPESLKMWELFKNMSIKDLELVYEVNKRILIK